MKTAIVVCTRLNSTRVPRKPLLNINGKCAIEHLHDRLKSIGLPIIYAVGADEFEYAEFLQGLGARIVHGHDSDPLARMQLAAVTYDLECVVRVTHDKIFIDKDAFYTAHDKMRTHNFDYVYSSDLTPGTGFEIIRSSLLYEAARRFKEVEHISYAIKTLAERPLNLPMVGRSKEHRLLIDYPQDVNLMNVIFACLGNDCTLQQVSSFLENHGWARKLNRLPAVTVYTCAHNAEQWIEKCMGSVAAQKGFSEMEYILIDDHSTDGTAFKMARFASKFKNVRYIRNPKNLGLASSSNIALAEARGEYIVRMDADDYFVPTDAVLRLMDAFEVGESVDVVYPANYFGKRSEVQRGDLCHHVGGAMFKTRALNHVKFTDGLRGYEGLDLFVRAKEVFKIRYLNFPIFFYTQRDGSMSKTDLAEREEIKRKILAGGQIENSRN